MSDPDKVTTCLWFDTQGEDAAKFYTSLVPHSSITHVSRYGPGMPMPEGTAMVVKFTLGGASYMALNGGPMFKHSEAASIVVSCDDQAEVDRLWSALAADGGKAVQCGWLKDRYGLSWQIVPRRLEQLMTDPDSAKRQRTMAALMQMVKLDIGKLEAAHRGDGT